MPLRDYRCKECGAVLEVLERMGATDKVSCASCGGDTDRVVSCATPHFKGIGFFSTDYRKTKHDV